MANLVDVNVVFPLIIFLLLLSVTMSAIVLWQRKFLIYKLKSLRHRGFGCDVFVLDAQRGTIRQDFVGKIEDFDFGQGMLAKITNPAPNEAVNPLEIPKIPYAKNETTGNPSYFFFKGVRTSWNPFSKLPSIMDSNLRRQNYLNTWHLRGLYDQTFGSSMFNKLVLAGLFILGLLVVGVLYQQNDQNDTALKPMLSRVTTTQELVFQNNTILKVHVPDWNNTQAQIERQIKDRITNGVQ